MFDYDKPLLFDQLTMNMAVVNQDRTRGGHITAITTTGFTVNWHDRGPVNYPTADAAYLKRARGVLYVDETMPIDGGFVPSMVTECQPGHTPLTGAAAGGRPWVWGPTIDLARKTAEDTNNNRGIDPDTAREVVISSFRASAA